jgi:Heterokaryon incompatibility protein (HET)
VSRTNLAYLGTGHISLFRQQKARRLFFNPVSHIANAPSGSASLHNLQVVGRRASQKVELDLGVAWIRECSEKHPDCKHEDETLLPSRIIDVGTSDGQEIPCLRLCSEERGHYVTLSHCWGPSNPTRTTAACFQDYLQGIPLANLPKTYRDAIAVTRRLGIRYLWIDSLCIIQDSSEDWEKECIKMPQIYQNSTVIIAGPAASGCESGFLDRQPQPGFSDLLTDKETGSVQVLMEADMT